MEIRDFCTKDTPKREEIGGAWRWKNGNKKGPQQQIATALSGVSICKTLCASYFRRYQKSLLHQGSDLLGKVFLLLFDALALLKTDGV